MDILGFTVNSILEWILAIFVLVILMVAAFYIGRLLLQYTTGMVGGFLFMIIGMGMILGPSFYLMDAENVPRFQMLLSGVSIFLGCAAVLAGAFSLTNFRNF